MNVAQVVLTMNVGGLEHLVIELSEQLQQRGFRSDIICLTEGVLVDEARSRGVRTFVLNRKREGMDLSTVFKLRQIVKNEALDLLHTHNFSPLVYGTLAAKLTGIGSINTRHGPAQKSANRLIWHLTDRVVAVSEDSRREMLRHNTIAERKTSVVINAIDLSQYIVDRDTLTENMVRRDFKIGPEQKLIGNAARLAPEKDQPTLLRAFRRLVDEGLPVHLMIMGGGELEQPLKNLAAELGIAGRVHFLGFRKDLADVLRCLDLYVVPSTLEGVSLSLLQAMAAGCPVVVTRAGGNPEVVEEGETGFIVECGDVEGMAGAMKALVVDEAKARLFGRRNREKALKRFGIDRMVQSYVDIYRDVVPRATVSPRADGGRPR